MELIPTRVDTQSAEFHANAEHNLALAAELQSDPDQRIAAASSEPWTLQLFPARDNLEPPSKPVPWGAWSPRQ